MIDFYAGEAVGAKGTPATKKMKHFYDQLEARGFADIARKIDGVLKAHSLGYSFGSRVIDKFLWLEGCGRTDDELDRENEFLLARLPREDKTTLRRAARAIPESICNVCESK